MSTSTGTRVVGANGVTYDVSPFPMSEGTAFEVRRVVEVSGEQPEVASVGNFYLDASGVLHLQSWQTATIDRNDMLDLMSRFARAAGLSVARVTTDNEMFARYYDRRADVAEALDSLGLGLEARICITTALDSLVTVWEHDFPADLAFVWHGGTQPASNKMARLVKRFAPTAEHAGRVAVVSFAEDWKLAAAGVSADADALLAPRLTTMAHALPLQYLDCTIDDLASQCPALSREATLPEADRVLTRLAEEYEYPAMLYRYVRSALAHGGTSAKRTHGFAQGEQAFYMRLHGGRHSFDMGLKVMTAWVRTVAHAYAAQCDANDRRCADNLDSGKQADTNLANRWRAYLKPKKQT